MSLRARLAQDTPLLAPGAYDALSALLVEQAGFEAIYLSGASIAYTQLGRPDIGLVSFDQVADVVGRVSERVRLPLIVDGDTGFGNAVNVQRTVRIFERMGASAIQLEDQTFPKKCGHLADKSLVPTAEMAGKIRAALDARASEETLIIARTDAIGVEGFEAALDRAHAYVEAGADVLFVEAPRSIGEMSAIAHAFAGRAPLLANMVEGGKTPLLDVNELGRIGFKLVISPGALVRALVPAAEAFLASLKANGATRPFAERMIDMGGVNDRIGLADMARTGAAYAAG
ncbi:carboxyvinyl-carboxyphosphonate phosphorylmutase [Caulobacter flavus]|uniref:Carboxyvinyl-carboxyphosphonate phosphorylmutase n=1 Tax=Caulobacter flavus TaxID=1679497 RepID=A0A2N5CL87_9CAUL|nr:isocitrate lyase/PEP mutase family protein [Caulobacter flavus]AYV48332.1 carboxyvinyl-carboxyphosphonate phosphorylmutase [Caulobacter flavus]PLR06492.1 carboxyvinyl-carboxyphosphonate phosphorylmutase [Caulobacter flavus]